MHNSATVCVVVFLALLDGIEASRPHSGTSYVQDVTVLMYPSSWANGMKTERPKQICSSLLIEPILQICLNLLWCLRFR
uniref:Putative secreted protein n=1 Tax=Panstrongylus lignarius TaxID=156445 RepID=A0A224Y564_9HEMI